MSLLKMITNSKTKPEISIHIGFGWIKIPYHHLTILTEYFHVTGINLIDSYRDVLAWSNDNYVDYLIEGEVATLDVIRSEAASNINKIRAVNIFDNQCIWKAFQNTERLSKYVYDSKISKRKTRRKKASKFTQRPDVKGKVFELHGKECLACGSTNQLCLDHVVPVSRGGKDEIDNMQPLCFVCNSSKSTQIIDYRE